MSIKSRLLLILGLIAMLCTGMIAAHLMELMKSRDNSTIINLSGNLRFRTYKIVVLATEYLHYDDQAHGALKEAINKELSTVDNILRSLRNGSAELGIDRQVSDGAAAAQLAVVEKMWHDFRGHIEAAIAGSADLRAVQPLRDESHALVLQVDKLVNILAAGMAAEVRKDILRELVFLCLTLVLLAATLLICRKKVFDPLREATEFAAQIAGHDFRTRMTMPAIAGSTGEVGILVATLNDMAGRLENLYNNLELKVQERTEELYATHQELYASQEELQSHVAELTKLNARLQETRDALVSTEKLAGIGTLAAGVAHEINNPLAAIIGFAEGVMRDIRLNRGDDEHRLKALERICEAGWRCARIVAALKSYARDDSFDIQPNDLNQIIETALSLVAAQLRHGGIDVSLELGQDMPQVECDEHKMEQIVINLVMNAKDAMSSGGSIAIRSRVDDDMAIVEVEDSGTGIPPDIQAKVFDPFFTTKEVGKGTGLGLSICHGIVEKHQGSIKLESAEGRGTKITVAIPVKSRAPQAPLSSSTDLPPSEGGRYAG